MNTCICISFCVCLVFVTNVSICVVFFSVVLSDHEIEAVRFLDVRSHTRRGFGTNEKIRCLGPLSMQGHAICSICRDTRHFVTMREISVCLIERNLLDMFYFLFFFLSCHFLFIYFFSFRHLLLLSFSLSLMSSVTSEGNLLSQFLLVLCLRFPSERAPLTFPRDFLRIFTIFSYCIFWPGCNFSRVIIRRR